MMETVPTAMEGKAEELTVLMLPISTDFMTLAARGGPGAAPQVAVLKESGDFWMQC